MNGPEILFYIPLFGGLPVTGAPDVVFEDVWFRYPGTGTDVLKGVSFRLAPGRSVSLVGENGSGKSTIVKLLLRLYRPTKGRITLIAGAGVGADNIAQIAQISGVREFHFSAKDTVPSQMQFRNPDVFMGLPGSNEYALQITSLSKVIATVRALCESQVK